MQRSSAPASSSSCSGFFFFTFLENLYSQVALRIHVSIGTSKKIESSKRNLRFPFKKKRVNLRRFLLLFSVHPEPEGRKVDKMLTLKKVKEMVKAPVHTKRVPSPKVLLEEGRIFLHKEFEHGSHLTLYHNGYVWFSAGKRNTVFHIHDCRGDYAYGASKGKGEVIKEEYFENCEWHIRALFEGEQRVEESQLKCEGVGQTKVCVSYHAVAEDWGEMADSEINVLDKYIEKEALHAMMAVLTKKQRNLIYQNYVLDKTHQEIADGMGIARGSVTRSVNQALERIRRKFDFEAHYELAVGDFT